ncbi:LLM class F420-dependent oxidoreductase [Streptomyces sp. TS71-3]|uniref:LLM class F420-dependent oxidoreductase n=1 Tax=Streptomyces sp. TS71-3 TaxID=2733862 RepID=UPI001B21522A|nr:LLM class F420-dependent oxidoreductase [Streptomyces sp. TS71-3]GHJ39121.1 LLM class F420-dependent oxidoreductase [Streptomyces sp. TS71-3]
MTVPAFRFGVSLTTTPPGDAWRATCRSAEDMGYDTILVADHLGMPAPFPALVAAAEATERPRLGTFVLNAGFWNPALLAREVATTDALTGGRLELGLGTGYVADEHTAAGLPFGSPGERVDHVVRTVEELDRLLGSAEHAPAAVQRPRVPLLVGGNGDRMLDLAARRADIVGFSGLRPERGSTSGGLIALTAAQLDDRVAAYRRLAAGAGREQEFNLLIQRVTVTGDRRATAREIAQRLPYLTEDQALELPVFPAGTVRQIAEQLRAQRERYGFSYLTVLEPSMKAFAPVIEELRGGG